MCEKEYEYKIDNGIWQIKPSVGSWKDFHELLLNKKLNLKIRGQGSGLTKEINLKDFVWRGHRCEDWKLTSLFDRKYNSDDGRRKLGQHLDSFAYACRGKLKEFDLTIREIRSLLKNKILNPNHIWALGQHYGLATPLLDWCYSPFTAAYFAFEEKNLLEDIDWKSNSEKFKDLQKMCEDTKLNNFDIDNKIKNKFRYRNRVVWGLKYKDVFENTKNHIVKNGKKYVFEYFDPMSSEYPRLINQRGLFTISNTGENIERIVEKYCCKNKDKEPLLIEITINNDQREEFLRNLDAMNINHMTLFSEIYGAAKFCNIGSEENMEDYALFHGQD